MKFALCNETYGGWDFDRSCAHIAESGYHGIEIAPFTLKEDPRTISESESIDFGKRASAAGLEVWSSLATGQAGLAPPDNRRSPTAEGYHRLRTTSRTHLRCHGRFNHGLG